MKRLIKKTSGLIKGAPTAVVVSIAIHLLLFFALGSMVVFNVVQRHIEQFRPPPPIERPKMPPKQPLVKVKTSSKPKAMSRIVSKSALSVTDFQLPDVPSFGSGLSGGVDGFEMMPDPSEITLFGAKKSTTIGNDLVGTFYSMHYDRRSREIGMNSEEFLDVLTRFLEKGWNPNALARFYRLPQKLYATQMMIPTFFCEDSLDAVGLDGTSFHPHHWIVHYKGKFASKEGGRFRFAGMGDAVMLLRVKEKMVMNANWGRRTDKFKSFPGFFNSAEEDYKYPMADRWESFGDWFELEPGVPAEMEMLIGAAGGIGTYILLIQQEGVTYKKNQAGAPILPIFKTAEMPDHLLREIEYLLIEGDPIDLTGGPLFNVY